MYKYEIIPSLRSILNKLSKKDSQSYGLHPKLDVSFIIFPHPSGNPKPIIE